LGGCTAHNALFMVYPHNADWDQIAELRRLFLNAENMRKYSNDWRTVTIDRFNAGFTSASP
jgi:hypothetical protein